MWIRNKRAWMADRLCELGLVRLLERIGRRPCLVTLVYHRVGEAANDPFYRPLIVDPGVFERQMRHLGDAFRVIGLEELESRFEESGQLPLTEPTALVTFDDGYRDNATTAAPILQRLGIPAAIFVTTGFVGAERVIPWWDRAAYAVQAAPGPTLRLDRPGPITLELTGDRAEAVRRVIEPWIAAGWQVSEADLAHLEERAGIDHAALAAASARLFLDPGELSALPRTTFSLAGHTHTHRRLGGLERTAQVAELSDSRALLESWLGRPVRSVAYPYGGPGSIDQATSQASAETGCVLGFGLNPRPLRPGPVDPFELPRFAVSPADSSHLLRARLALAASLGWSLV
jgi:peptidoglycan/xylan/chitin deacetylase (PgdA/CDA1 family)